MPRTTGGTASSFSCHCHRGLNVTEFFSKSPILTALWVSTLKNLLASSFIFEQAVTPRLLVRLMLGSTREILARTLRRSVGPKHLRLAGVRCPVHPASFFVVLTHGRIPAITREVRTFPLMWSLDGLRALFPDGLRPLGDFPFEVFFSFLCGFGAGELSASIFDVCSHRGGNCRRLLLCTSPLRSMDCILLASLQR